MNFRDVAFLGWRYLARNRVKTLLLVAAFTLVLFLPGGLALMVSQVESQLRARAEETPLLLGQAGSPLELVFNALYFTEPGVATFPYGETEEVAEDGLASVVPIYARFSAGGHRIVGTSLDYFDFRGLEVAWGAGLAELGDCVLGSLAAESAGLGPGDALISSPETLFDLAGVYPLKMKVVGVLAPTGTPDDSAVFVDLMTAWIIEGLGHGHAEAASLGEEARVPGSGEPSVPGGGEGESGKNEEALRLNASVVQYNEITADNVGDFHFHGDIGDYPVSAAIVVPADLKARAILKGRYGEDGGLQLLTPDEEMDQLFTTVFGVQRVVLRLLAAIGLATLSLGGLVFLLSHRLRREEFRHLRQMGASPGFLRALVAFETVFVVSASLVASAAGLVALHALAPTLVRAWTG